MTSSRRLKRQLQRERKKALAREAPYQPPSNGTRAFVIVISLTMIFLFLYLALRDNSLRNVELGTLSVTLKESPRYDEYKIKSTTYQDITLTTKEYERKFKIAGMTYKAIDHAGFATEVRAGDIVELKVRKSEMNDLDNFSLWNNFNDVYGLQKNGKSYIDIGLRTELLDKDSKWSYFFVAVGLVMLPYGFIKSKPYISMDKAVTVTLVIAFVILLLLKS
jgi:hypothetical protein